MGKLRDHLLPRVKEKALKYNLDEKLLDAIIQMESSYDFYAVRFEPHSTYLVTPDKFAKFNNITEITEQKLQCISWGLFQIMGSTARGLEFNGPLPSLCDVDTNLELGCKFIIQLNKKYASIEDLIAAYNAGSARKGSDGKYSNQRYVDKALEKMKG